MREEALDTNVRLRGEQVERALQHRRPHTVAAHARVELEVNAGAAVRVPGGLREDLDVRDVAHGGDDVVLKVDGRFLGVGWAEHEHRRGDPGLAQLDGFLGDGDAQQRRPGLERGLAHLNRAVAVGVGLDDGQHPDLGPDDPPDGANVVSDRAEVYIQVGGTQRHSCSRRDLRRRLLGQRSPPIAAGEARD